MALEDEKIEAVQRSWALAAAMPDRVARSFYANLFRIDPSTKPLFVHDLDLQGRKLTATLDFIVDHLDDTDRLLPAARDLAVRHVPYGVVASQYTSVGAALITTLKQMLGPSFSARDEAAWGEIYTMLADHMCNCAYGEEPPYTKG